MVEKGCREGVCEGVIRHVGKVWWTVSCSLCLSAVCLAVKCVSVCACVRVCIRGCSGGHSPDHQINFHSDIPALPKPENTTTGSMNVCTPFCEYKKVLLYIYVQNSYYVPRHTKIGVRPFNKIPYVHTCVCMCVCCDLCKCIFTSVWA